MKTFIACRVAYNHSNNSDTDNYSDVVENFDQFKNRKHSYVVPKAFTEKGLYMLATILKNEKKPVYITINK